MTESQWIYYFAAELVSVVPQMSLTEAVAWGRRVEPRHEPEVAAGVVATLFDPDGGRRCAVDPSPRARLRTLQ